MTRCMRYSLCVLLSAACLPTVAHGVQVTEVRLAPESFLQGEGLTVSYTLVATGKDVSATVVWVPGSVSDPPGNWADAGVRPTPKYQVLHQKLSGTPVSRTCSVRPAVTRDMEPGPWSVFAAVLEAGAGWRFFKLGEVTVRDASTIPMLSRDGQSRVAILQRGFRPRGYNPDVSRITEVVRQAGCDAAILGIMDLRNSRVFSRKTFDLLILPDDSALPEQAADVVTTFLRQAGSVLMLGAPPSIASVVTAKSDAPPSLVADMEGGRAAGSARIHKGIGSEGALSILDSGANGTGRALELEVRELSDWLYAEWPLADVVTPDHRYLEFYARGDARADRLCIELVEQDGSRWKTFVTLDPTWRGYTIDMRDMARYVGDTEDGRGHRFQPAQAAWLKLGVYRALFDDEVPTKVWFDEIQLSAAPHHPIPTRYDHAARWREQYRRIKATPLLDALGLFKDITPLGRIATVAPTALQCVFDETVELAGPAKAWHLFPDDLSGPGRAWSDDTSQVARYVPLLRALDADESVVGDVAGMLIHHAGEFRGACTAWSTLSSHDMLDDSRPGLAEGLTRLVRSLTSSAHILRASPQFHPAPDGIAQTWTVDLLARGRSLPATLELLPLSGEAATRGLTLEPGRITTVSVNTPPGAVDLARFGAILELRVDDRPIDRMDAVADARQALETTGEWLVDNQHADGNFSRFFYADVYGARALRALSAITGDTRYRDAALRMMDMLVRDQREDGGWWVGYGPPRDLVFVADNGCIALGLVQMAPYVDADRRKRYLQAARRHIEFRERFRITPPVATELRETFGPNHPGIEVGGLGIGWVLRDYFNDRRLHPEPYMERRQKVWTLHCSLAFLGGLCALEDDPQACELAEQDTAWFLYMIEQGRDSVTTGYANETAFWMLDTLDDPTLTTTLRTLLRDSFIPATTDSEATWWLRSEARQSLMLPGLVYCFRHIDGNDDVRAGLARALWWITSPASPTSLPNVLQRHPSSAQCAVIMYAGFSSVGLAELLSPRATMLPAQHVE